MNKYEECLALSKEQGLYLDDRIERKQENGLYGMYATAKIPKGTLIASLPKTSLLPQIEGATYTKPNEKWAHVIAKELQKGKASSYRAHTLMLETLDELKQHSLYFFSPEERMMLTQMNPILGIAVDEYFYQVDSILKTVKEREPDLDDDLAIQAVLNTYCRSWENWGLLPVIDLFNHSEEKGVVIDLVEDGSQVGIVINRDYEPNEQVWVSYGTKDVLMHATFFNYFDPSDQHVIDYAFRAIQVLDSPQKEEIAEFTSQHYDTKIFEYQGQKKMSLNESGLYIFEKSPSKKLMDYFKKIGFTTLAELKLKKCSPLSACLTYSGVINAFLGANQVDNYKVTKLPKKLHRFHRALKKEKQMLLANKAWVEREISLLNSK
jgi:hypothetical protein